MSAVKNPGEGVAYTPNGHWKPTVHGCVCEYCGGDFTGHKYGQRFCTRSCSTKATAERRYANVKYTKRKCPGCDKLWSGPPSNPSQYCSKACLFESGKWVKSRRAKCPVCTKEFRSRWRGANDRKGYQKYCSNECAGTAAQRQIEKACVECGNEFTVSECRKSEMTCSKECQKKHFIRDRHHAWQGGKVLQSDRKFRRIDREGYAAKYEGEHRLVAAREVGRPLVRGEVVLCIDGNNDNFLPENLFLVPNLKEFGFIQNGTVEWPAESNLRLMRNADYIRPDVILTLHEWENGQRRENPRGKAIARHPQADEIIKRRKAGASARELAKEFGTSLSTMANTLRKRL